MFLMDRNNSFDLDEFWWDIFFHHKMDVLPNGKNNNKLVFQFKKKLVDSKFYNLKN